MSRLALPLVLLGAVAALAYAPAPVPAADGPAAPADTTRFQNLQVFPDDIPEDQLIAAMRSFSAALGVRCGHCHVREGEDFVFASDANPHKDVARQMLRMTRQINRDFLADIEGLHNPVDADDPATWAVTCWTCHRGDPTPQRRQPEAPPAADSTHGGHDAPAQGGDGGEQGRTHRHGDGTEHRHDD